MEHARNSTLRLTVVVTVLFATAVLTACHPRINAVDPGAENYGGTLINDDSDALAQLLPTTASWEIRVSHGDASYSLTIPESTFGDPDFYVEPRQSEHYYVVISFGEPISQSSAEQSGLFIISDNGTTTTLDVRAPDGGDEGAGTIWYELDAELDLAQTVDKRSIAGSTRMRLVDLSGVTLGEREFGLLVGDFNGDGFVNAFDRADGPDVLVRADLNVGPYPTEDEIRADVDSNGEIGSDDSDMINAISTLGLYDELPGPPPTF